MARKFDGTAIAWGKSQWGGNTDGRDLTNVADVMCGGYACVARKFDGIAVAWGNSYAGGDASSVDLTNVADVMCGGHACVARKFDGIAVAWGDSRYGGDASHGKRNNSFLGNGSLQRKQSILRKNDTYST